jgi:hypothetical protein
MLTGHYQLYLRTGHVIGEELKIRNLNRLIHTDLSILVPVRPAMMKKLVRVALHETSRELLTVLRNLVSF